MKNTRNEKGFKDTIDCYRTIKGDRYISWFLYPSEGRKEAYRLVGAKIRQFKETLYVKETDRDIVASVDAIFEL